jgi:acetylxylan esterase
MRSARSQRRMNRGRRIGGRSGVPRTRRVSTRSALIGFILCGSSMLTTQQADAASLQQVTDWDRAGLPSDISMYAYVPDNAGESPPLLVLVHYCGGTAPAVFGQAQGGGLVRAADQYGFIVIAPSSGRCWDVVSNATRTRDGSGDSHAIRRMVAHAIAAYGANAERVYATGDSSGGMMTELLLALYPDVFKAGSAMAGMPAACRGADESGNGGGYSGACAGGNVSQTAQEWGNLVRALYPGYTGARPRVQLFHGDNDAIINYSNHTEALKEWRDVLRLELAPTSTESGLQLGTHTATRQTWVGECGRPVLDAFTSLGGDHGPSDALFLAEHLVPFLGLNDTGLVDPVVAACNDLMGGAAGDAGQGSSVDAGSAAAPDGAGVAGRAPGPRASGAMPNTDNVSSPPVGGAGDGLPVAGGAMGANPGSAPGALATGGPSTVSSDNSSRGCSLASQHRGVGSGRLLAWLPLLALASYRCARRAAVIARRAAVKR